jgi:hypothetical protein
MGRGATSGAKAGDDTARVQVLQGMQARLQRMRLPVPAGGCVLQA